jgi:arsenite methyltransferase
VTKPDRITMASSTGQEGAEACFLDSHFEARRPAYEAMLRAVDMKSGWHVLDAGCGSGSYRPLLAELVGSTGQINAFDLAPDNVGAIRERVSQIPFDIR